MQANDIVLVRWGTGWERAKVTQVLCGDVEARFLSGNNRPIGPPKWYSRSDVRTTA